MKKIGYFLLLSLLMANCSVNSENGQKDKTVRHSAVNIKKDTREFVDLGLPSGIKWATCNIGASVPEMGGYHFAFGEVSPRTEFEDDMYFVKREDMDTDKDPLLEFLDDSLEIGLAGNAKYDVVRFNWGDSYRLPTRKDFKELIAYCDANWTTKNGVTGCEFTSTKTGNSIFLPAVRSKRNKKTDMFWGSSTDVCNYMSGTVGKGSFGVILMCTDMEDNEDGPNVYCSPTAGSRSFGFVVRPVQAPDTDPFPNNKTKSSW